MNGGGTFTRRINCNKKEACIDSQMIESMKMRVIKTKDILIINKYKRYRNLFDTLYENKIVKNVNNSKVF